MKKIFIVTVVLALALVPLAIGAQTPAEFQYLSFDIGYAPGWDFGNSSQITPSLFGINVRISDKLSAGIQTLQDATTDNFLLLKYSFLSQVRATVGFGVQDTGGANDAASSLGFEVIPFSRSVGGLAATEFKVAVKYDSPFANMVNGKILFALAFGIGF
ncbi:MAG: hypothetical protein LBF95_08090 [Treponema sp.]|nr:hypothetical protein [Treponema sp.]